MKIMLEIIEKPTETGLYLCYINPQGLFKNYADYIVLFWSDRWYYRLSDQKYRDTVYQCIGPIPPLELVD